MAFKDIAKGYTKVSLIKRIIVGLIIGVILALAIPAGVEAAGAGSFGGDTLTVIGDIVALCGTLFVKALKAVAPILVFFIVISALANAHASASMKTVIVLYIVSTFMAAVVAVVASIVFPITVTLDTSTAADQASPESIGVVLTTLLTNITANPVDALTNANYIGILAWAIVLGVALRAASQNVRDVFTAVSDAVATIVRWVINLAPFGIMGLVYTAVVENGLEIFIEYGQLILVLVVCMLVSALVVNPIMVFVATKKNPYPLIFRCLKDSGLTAFFTRSSAANIPVNMELCRKLGLNKDNYSMSIPLGATINMAGAAVTITLMAMTAAHTLGVYVDPVTAVILSVLAAAGACGASGVAGGSLLLIPMCCALFGIGNDIAMQMVGIGFIIGVIQDSCETALNSSSDVLFTATAEYRSAIKRGIEVHMGKDSDPLPE